LVSVAIDELLKVYKFSLIIALICEIIGETIKDYLNNNPPLIRLLRQPAPASSLLGLAG
jgi:hypothetical protein